jgi:hypothetical protein
MPVHPIVFQTAGLGDPKNAAWQVFGGSIALNNKLRAGFRTTIDVQVAHEVSLNGLLCLCTANFMRVPAPR